MRVVEQFSVARPPKEVFKYVAVKYFENHTKFDPEVHEMIWRTKAPVSIGTKGTERRKFAGKRVLLDFEVTDFKPFKFFALQNTSGPFSLDRSYSLEPISNGTKVTFVFDMHPKNLPVKLVFPLLRNKFRKSVSDNIHLLKGLLNGERG